MQDEYKSDIFIEKRPVYADFGQRLGASLIDGVILWAFGLLIKIPFGLGWSDTNTTDTILSIVVGWLYSALQESGKHRATIGKRALNIQVVNVAGGRLSFAQATGRHFAKLISVVILFIGYLMVLWDDRRQALHDKMAGTFVIRKGLNADTGLS